MSVLMATGIYLKAVFPVTVVQMEQSVVLMCAIRYIATNTE